jgi:hypothetical protein
LFELERWSAGRWIGQRTVEVFSPSASAMSGRRIRGGISVLTDRDPDRTIEKMNDMFRKRTDSHLRKAGKYVQHSNEDW